MRVTLKQKNLSITPSLRAYIDAKLVVPVKKLISRTAGGELPILDIEVARTTIHHRKGMVFYAEANMSLGKRLIRVEAEDEDIHAAIDALKDELEGRIKSLKEKITSLERSRGRKAKQSLRQKS